jgi:serine/threonine-protein phosphatase 6 regulatory ankyrin repeat subunit B
MYKSSRELLTSDTVDVNLLQTIDAVTALWIASYNGHGEVVKALLANNKLDVNLQHIDGTTALWMASQNGHVQVVEALLQHDKVDVNLRSTE